MGSKLLILLVLLLPASLFAQAPHVQWQRTNVFASSLTTSADGNTLLLFDGSIIEVWNVANSGHPKLLYSPTPHTWDYNEFSDASFTAAGISADGSIVAYTTTADQEVVVKLGDSTLYEAAGGEWSGDSTLNWTGGRTSIYRTPNNPNHSFFVGSNRQVFELDIPSSTSSRFGNDPIIPSVLAVSPDNQLIAAGMGSKIYLLGLKDGSVRDTIVADTTVDAITFNTNSTKVGYFTEQTISIYDLNSRSIKKKPHAAPRFFSPVQLAFQGKTDNIFAAQDSNIWLYQTDIDTGLWRRSVSGAVTPTAFSKDGSEILFMSGFEYVMAGRYRTADISLIDTIGETNRYFTQTYHAPMAFSTTPDTIYYAAGFYDPVENFDQGWVLGYSFQSDSSFKRIGGSVDQLVANGRLVLWQFSTPYFDEGGVYDQLEDSEWSFPASGPVAVGSDTLRGFVSGGIDGITMWRWDSTFSGVKDQVEETAQDFQVVPNPCSSSGEMKFSFNVPEHFQITLFDELGSKRASVFDGSSGIGEQHIPFDVSTLQNGIYFGVIRSSSNFEVAQFSVLH